MSEDINKKIAKIPLYGKRGEGKFAIVDIEDYPVVNLFKWYLDKTGNYCVSSIHFGKKAINIRMHRLIMNTPKDLDTDHVNQNKLNNRRVNLRICSRSQNNSNSYKKQGKTSKYKGVHWYKSNKKWMAKIQKNKKQIFLGYFHEEDAAAQAYDIMARKLFGEFAVYNNIGIS